MPLLPENIKYLIVHHTATARDTTTFEAVKKYHQSLGWGDIGYHYFITADGKLWTGRGLDKIGAHCKADGMNYKSLGICLTGNFCNEHPTGLQLERLKQTLQCLKTMLNINPDNILGHKEVKGAQTACPGDNLLKKVLNLRNIDLN